MRAAKASLTSCKAWTSPTRDFWTGTGRTLNTAAVPGCLMYLWHTGTRWWRSRSVVGLALADSVQSGQLLKHFKAFWGSPISRNAKHGHVLGGLSVERPTSSAGFYCAPWLWNLICPHLSIAVFLMQDSFSRSCSLNMLFRCLFG